jgi:hypothetical protein
MWSCGICGGQSDAGAGFLRVLRFPLPIFIPPIAPQSPSSIIWGLYNRPEVAAVPSGLSPTPLIINNNNVRMTVYHVTLAQKGMCLWCDAHACVHAYVSNWDEGISGVSFSIKLVPRRELIFNRMECTNEASLSPLVIVYMIGNKYTVQWYFQGYFFTPVFLELKF